MFVCLFDASSIVGLVRWFIHLVFHCSQSFINFVIYLFMFCCSSNFHTILTYLLSVLYKDMSRFACFNFCGLFVIVLLVVLLVVVVVLAAAVAVAVAVAATY